MTLNITALHKEFVIQVSDRRLTHVIGNTVIVSDDSANKAVILSCADGLVAVTYTGLGRLDALRVDEWLAETLQEEGLGELPLETAVNEFANLATDWFRSFRLRWRGPHTFVLAGWRRTSTNEPIVWIVSNTYSNDYDSFSVTRQTKTGVGHVTGWLKAFTRHERRRLEAALRKAHSAKESELALVGAIRNAACRPDGTAIGKNCMSVIVLPTRQAVARFYPDGRSDSNFGPHVVWYDGGRNFVVKGIDYLPAGKYVIGFGEGPLLVVRVNEGSSTIRPELAASFSLRIGTAKHRQDPIRETSLFRVIEG